MSFLKTIETQTFSIDGDNTVETNMQINVDITVASTCQSLIVNVLDQSNDRLFASELLQMDPVDFTGPVEEVHDDHNCEDDKEDENDHEENILLNKKGHDHSAHDLHAHSLAKRKESLYSVLSKTSNKNKFNKVPTRSKSRSFASLTRGNKPVISLQEFIDGNHGCRIYGSIPVTKVQGNLHIISKPFFHSGMILPRQYRMLLSSKKARKVEVDKILNRHADKIPKSPDFNSVDLLSLEPQVATFSSLNFTHYIDELSFGEYYPKMINPLDGTRSRLPKKTLFRRFAYYLEEFFPFQADKKEKANEIPMSLKRKIFQKLKDEISAASSYQYFLSIVPTRYTSSVTFRHVSTNQYAVTEQIRDLSYNYEYDDDEIMDEIETFEKSQKDSGKGSKKPHSTEEYFRKIMGSSSSPTPPGIYFKYDIEPIVLNITDKRLPFVQFAVRVVNILGGLAVCFMIFYQMTDSLWDRFFGHKIHLTEKEKDITGILGNEKDDEE